MFRSRIFWVMGLAVALALTFGARSASADTLIYDLTSFNQAGFTGPFAEVTVNVTSPGVATITFDSGSGNGPSGPVQYLLGGGTGTGQGTTAANLTTPFTLVSFSGTPFPGSTGTLIDQGPGNMDGFGSFNQTVSTNASGPGNAFTEIVWNVTGSFTTAAQVTNSALGNLFAVHIGTLASGATSFGVTGFADSATIHPPAVPEPSTMAIAGLGALGFIGYSLRRRLKK